MCVLSSGVDSAGGRGPSGACEDASANGTSESKSASQLCGRLVFGSVRLSRLPQSNASWRQAVCVLVRAPCSSNAFRRAAIPRGTGQLWSRVDHFPLSFWLQGRPGVLVLRPLWLLDCISAMSIIPTEAYELRVSGG